VRILFCVPSLKEEAGGPAIIAPKIAQQMGLLGVDVRLVTADQKGWRAELARLENGRFDLAVNFGMWTPFNYLAAYAARRNSIPYVAAPLGMLEPWALAQKRIKKKIAWTFYQRAALEKSALIHATAESEARNIKQLGIKTPVCVVPHGIEVLNRPNHSRKNDIRTALFLSRIHPKKGLRELVLAWREVRPPGWQLVISGPDTDGYGLEILSLIRSLELNEIQLIGPTYGLRKIPLYESAEIFILPTHSENFGLVIPEALSFGLPVITTTAAPWWEIEEYNCGWWIRPDFETLVNAIRQATSLPRATLRNIGENGRRLVLERYDWNHIGQMHLNMYMQAVNRRPVCCPISSSP
jgi:glycosyltransferase involved in cell wall biosynthesis